MGNLIYPGQRCKKNKIKKNLRQFKGFDRSEDPEKLTTVVQMKLNKMDLKMLKVLVQMLNLIAVGTKDELITTVTQFLFNPQPTGNAFIKPGAKLKKKKATPKKKSVKKKEETQINWTQETTECIYVVCECESS